MQLDVFAGTRLSGAIKMAEPAINELLNTPDSPARGATITVGPNNEVVFRYGMLHARARLPRAIEVEGGPQLRVQLASLLVAFAISAAVRHPSISVSGRDVTIALADIPALSALRDLWPHVTDAGLRTEPDGIVLEFTLSLTE